MNSVRLSICICTINRADFIKQTLESIIPQMTEEVELVLVDSSSNTETEEIVREFRGQCDNLCYVRDLERWGFGKAYAKAVEKAQGDYCWLFTDDDLVRAGAVAAILESSRKDYSLIVVNAEVRNEDLGKLLEDRRVPVSKDRVYSPKPDDQDRLLADTGMYLTFIGAVVIRRDLWNQRIKEEYFPSMFIHMIIIFASRLPGDACSSQILGSLFDTEMLSGDQRALESGCLNFRVLYGHSTNLEIGRRNGWKGANLGGDCAAC